MKNRENHLWLRSLWLYIALKLYSAI